MGVAAVVVLIINTNCRLCGCGAMKHRVLTSLSLAHALILWSWRSESVQTWALGPCQRPHYSRIEPTS